MARCLSSLGPFFESKLSTGTEPADILHGLYLGIDAQAVTRKDWRFKVNSANALDFDENTGTDASPVWVNRLSLPSGAGSTVTTDGQGIEISAGQLSLELDSTTLSKSASGVKVATGGITNTEVSASAAIAYSKLALTASVVNADIGAAAAIAYSKLALTGSVVNADIGAAAAIAYSKLALTGAILNADINASAAIAYSKLALTGSIVNADVNASAAIVYSKLSLAASIVNADIANAAAIAYSKLALTGTILNADISASAAIAYSKLALTGTIVNADVSASAAIAYSKLALTGTILNADISASAAIAYSKLALTGSIVNADISGSAAIAYSKLSLGTSIVNADVSATAAIAYSKLALTGTVVNADISASAAIAYSKLSLGTSIVNADIAGAAAIAYSKLNLATSIVNADIGAAAAIAYSKLNLATSIVNADVAAAAAIALSKLAALTTSRAVQTNSSTGALEVSAVTNTELGYVSGVTSAIQTQLNALSAGTGAFVLLHTYTPSGAASVDITSQISSTYDRYVIGFDLRPATDGSDLWLRTDSNNGASFDSAGSDYSYAEQTIISSATITGGGSTAAAQCLITNQAGVGNATNEGISGFIFLGFRGSASMYPQWNWLITQSNTTTVLRSLMGSGWRASAAAIDAVQLLFSTGNLTGTVRIYGLANT